MKLFEKKPKLPKRHAVLLLEDDPLYHRLDPRPLRVALAQVKEAKAAGKEDADALEKWEADLAAFEKIADPRNDDDVRTRLMLKDRINLMPRFIAEAEEKLEGLIGELEKEATHFEAAFRHANDVEVNAKADEIERLLNPYCIDYHNPAGTAAPDFRRQD